METEVLNSDDEVFVGEITERERNHPAFNSRRRTTVYFPGVSRPDSNITVYEEFTNDGTLLFSCEDESSNKINIFDHCSDSQTNTESEMSEIAEEKSHDKDRLHVFRSRTQLLHSSSLSYLEPEDDTMDSGFNSVSDASLSSTLSPQLSLMPETDLKANNLSHKCFNSGGNSNTCYKFSSTSKMPIMDMSFADSGYASPLPLKRKVAPKRQSSLSEPKSVLKNLPQSSDGTANHENVFQFHGKHSLCLNQSESAKKVENCKGVSGCSLFDLTFMSTKLQKLDINCECEKTSDKTKHTKIVSTLDSSAFTVRNADVIDTVLSGRHQVFVPETPDIKRMAFISSNRHKSFSKGCMPSQDQLEEEDSEIIPSSQRTESCASPFCATSDITMTPERINSTDSFQNLQTPPLGEINGSLHSPTNTSPDLFSSPPLDKSSSLSSPAGSAYLVFPNSHKYGRLNFRKPMVTASKKKNKENREKGSFYVSHSSFSCMSTIEDDSRAAMTRINTMINGEKRHYLLDPQSSPALLTDFPPPRQASRVSWSDSLIEEPGIRTSTAPKATTPRSILQQRADDIEFPFSEEPPSPIVLTRRRQHKPTRLVMFNS